MKVSPDSGAPTAIGRFAIDTPMTALLASPKIRAGKGPAREEMEWLGRGGA
jgi:hypothetical protein